MKIGPMKGQCNIFKAFLITWFFLFGRMRSANYSQCTAAPHRGLTLPRNLNEITHTQGQAYPSAIHCVLQYSRVALLNSHLKLISEMHELQELGYSFTLYTHNSVHNCMVFTYASLPWGQYEHVPIEVYITCTCSEYIIMSLPLSDHNAH